MADRMKIRVKGGPQRWSLRVEDAETGKLIPATDLSLEYDVEDGFLKARMTVLVWEVDAEAVADVLEEAEYLEARGYVAPKVRLHDPGGEAER